MRVKIIGIYESIVKSTLKKDIVASLILRMLNLSISLIFIPLSIKVLDVTNYGIWLTIYGLNSWISLFDLGTQNSLRNLLSGNNSENKHKWKNLILTNSFFFTCLLALIVIVIGLLSYYFLDFSVLLKIKSTNNREINLLILVSLFAFALKLVSNNFNAIIQSLQNTFLVLLVSVFSSISIILIIVYYYYFKHEPISIIKYGMIVLIFESIFSFIVPIIIIRYLKFKYLLSAKYLSYRFFKKHLWSSNFKFFVLSMLVVFTFFSDNFFIGVILSYKDVTVYNLVNKYFSLITIISIVALNPVWTKVATLYNSRDYNSIGQIMTKLYKSLYYFFGFTILLLLFAPLFYRIFGNNSVQVDVVISLVAALATFQLLYNNIHAYILNGMGFLSIQIKGFFIGAILIYPLYHLFCSTLHFGVAGAFLVQIFIFLPNSFMFYFASKKAINNR